MLGKLVVKIAQVGLKTTRKVSDIDVANPLTQDTLDFVITIAKEIINPF